MKSLAQVLDQGHAQIVLAVYDFADAACGAEQQLQIGAGELVLLNHIGENVGRVGRTPGPTSTLILRSGELARQGALHPWDPLMQ